jgi:hypothetical protein
MIVTERDKIAAKALVEVLNKAEFDLKGAEVLVAARVMEWASSLEKRIVDDLNPPKLSNPVIADKLPSPVESPKPRKKKNESK